MRCSKAWELYAKVAATDEKTAAQREALGAYIDHLHTCPVCKDHNQRLFAWARHNQEKKNATENCDDQHDA